MNPLLEKALEVDPGITSSDIWRDPPGTEAWEARKQLAKRYAWAIPNEEALEAISSWSPLVEIGAGTGYWARLLAYRGTRLVYIGECQGGCCANDNFFSMLESEWNLVREISLPQWWGIRDALFMYERHVRR